MSMIVSYLVALAGVWFWKQGLEAGLLFTTIGWLACIENSPLRPMRKQWNRIAHVTAQWSVYLYVLLYNYGTSEEWQQLACAILVTIFVYVKGKNEINIKQKGRKTEKIWVPWAVPVALFYVWNYWVTLTQPVAYLVLYGIVMLWIYGWYQKPKEKMYFWISQIGVWCFLSGFAGNGSEWVLLIIASMMFVMRKWGWRYIV